MSKRMVTYGLTNDDKVASVDGHELGAGGVVNKSISRRMITYKTDESGKIASIDGHELSGGGGYEIKPLEVTQNGVYDVAGEAYKPVRVNVPQTAASGTVKALFDALQRTNMLFQYYNGTTVSELISFNDTANVHNMSNMFDSCSNLTTIPALDTSKATNMKFMFYNCSKLTTIPVLDTSSATNMEGMFYGCNALKTIPALNASVASNTNNVFKDCTSLVSIDMYGFTRSIDISSTALGHDALVAFLNQAGTAYNSSQKITMGSAKLALLSAEEKAIATNKGWQLA